MKKIILVIGLASIILACGHSKKASADKTESTTSTEKVDNNNSNSTTTVVDNEPKEVNLSEIEWLDFETAIERNKSNKKLIFIDIYTDWCGWCKKMDATTFKNSQVIKYMNEHFYAVKMDAESKDPIPYKDKLYEWKSYGRAGYNTLAVSLLDSQMSFPSFVVLSKRETKLGKIIGYKDANAMMAELKKYAGK